MKKVTRLLAVLTVLALLLGSFACAKPEAAEPVAEAQPEATEAVAEATAEPAPAEKAPADYTGSLVVYSPHDADPLNAGVALFQAKYPNITVEVITGGTGELCQRVVAESANPQGDVLWGGGADTLAAYSDYFSPYVCANDAFIADTFKDANDLWIGESPLPMVIMYNKTLIDEANVPKPGKA